MSGTRSRGQMCSLYYVTTNNTRNVLLVQKNAASLHDWATLPMSTMSRAALRRVLTLFRNTERTERAWSFSARSCAGGSGVGVGTNQPAGGVFAI